MNRGPFLLQISFALSLSLVAVVLSGCSTVGSLSSDSPAADSLRMENEFLWSRLQMLSDSLAFIDSIESGGYHREARRKDEQIAELNYRLGVCADGGIKIAEELVDDLFQPASATLTEDGIRRLNDLIPMLGDIRFGELRIEGHSDNTLPGASISRTYPTNWELAGARASTVARHLIEAYGVDPASVTVVSHGASEPKYSNNTTEGRRNNRRIEFVVYYTPE